MSEFYSSHSGQESRPDDGLDVDMPISLQQVLQDGQLTPLESRFRYRQDNPYAVNVLFLCGDRSVGWTFGRELLIDGVYEPTGHGDVRAWPTLSEDGEAYVAFSTRNAQDGSVGMYMAPTRDMMLFLDQTLDLVPQGFESNLYERGDLTVQQFLNS